MPINGQIGRFQFDPICEFRGKQEIVIPRCSIDPNDYAGPSKPFQDSEEACFPDAYNVGMIPMSSYLQECNCCLNVHRDHRGNLESRGSLGTSKQSEKLWGTPDVGEHFLSAYKSVIGNGQLDWMLWWPSHFHFSTDWMIKINLSLNHPQPHFFLAQTVDCHHKPSSSSR